ncbi:MAG: SDR family oxidoreductase [Emergencia sp.]|nr:SDR family oxidoreductase [Emergencia sp.]
MKIDLSGKNAVITGAANGIGLETANLFRQCGAQVIGIDLSVKENTEIDYMTCDITDCLACQKIFAEIVAKYGHIDILVNCAGITQDAITYKMSEEQFDRVIAVNLKGMWNLTRFVGLHMQENMHGSIINISSIVGVYGNIGQSNYAASKAGVIGMTLSWAKEFSMKGGNVRVNAIAPGYTMTEMIKGVPQNLLDKFAAQTMLGRLAEPEEIAGAALFLASELSSYVTGTVLHVNGGMRL